MRKIATIATTLTLLCVAAFAQQKGTFTDARDKKAYKTVKIGEQVWMAENLSYKAEGSKCYAEGVTGVSADSIAKNCAKYGRLYNWETAKKACPKGWHLPYDKEWIILMRSVNPSCTDNNRCEGAGKLKATSGWNDNGNGTDDFGFAALPGGTGSSDGRFGNDGYIGEWWNASEKDANEAWELMMDHRRNFLGRSTVPKGNLISVRCIQGDEEEVLKVIAKEKTEAEAMAAKEKGETEAIAAKEKEEGEAYAKANGGKFTDTRDKKNYKTIKIGGQTWMAENLNYDAKGSKCYDDNPANCTTYGKLYDWATAMALPVSCNKNECASKVAAKHKGICPSGWHIPSDNDWKVLIKFINPSYVDDRYKTFKDGGTKLKATSGWKDNKKKSSGKEKSGSGTDAYGFAALPGGSSGEKCHLWGSESTAPHASELRIDEDVTLSSNHKDQLQSVRCLKD